MWQTWRMWNVVSCVVDGHIVTCSGNVARMNQIPEQIPVFTGWWFQTFLIFHFIYGIIVPIGERTFFRGVGIPWYTTNQFRFWSILPRAVWFRRFSSHRSLPVRSELRCHFGTWRPGKPTMWAPLVINWFINYKLH